MNLLKKPIHPALIIVPAGVLALGLASMMAFRAAPPRGLGGDAVAGSGCCRGGAGPRQRV
jgi:hypothetical protein